MGSQTDFFEATGLRQADFALMERASRAGSMSRARSWALAVREAVLVQSVLKDTEDRMVLKSSDSR